MKAIVCPRYGPPDVLRLAEVPTPVPKDNEVRVRIGAAAVTSSDCHVRGFKVPLKFWIPMALAIGVARPRQPILGMALAGEIDAAGKDVRQFKTGDRVFAHTMMRFGAYSEYACLPENSAVAPAPRAMTDEEAAAVPFGGLLALHFLKGKIRSGQNALVYGASGAVGTSAVQLAKYFGAEVTGVCSGANMELARSLGADRAIDYTTDDFTKRAERYDLVFDAVGKISSSQGEKALAPGGIFISVNGKGNLKPPSGDLVLLKELIESGRFKAVIDRRYPIEQIVEAHRYVDKGHKKGNVVVTIK